MPFHVFSFIRTHFRPHWFSYISPASVFFFSSSLPFSFYALFSLFIFFFLRLRTFRRYLLHPFFSRQNAFLRGIANIALDRRRTAPTKDTGNEVHAVAIFSVHTLMCERAGPSYQPPRSSSCQYTIGNTKSEYQAIPEQRLVRGAGEVSSRTTAETGDSRTDLRECLTAKPERMTQVP